MIDEKKVSFDLKNLSRLLKNYDPEFFTNAIDKNAYANSIDNAIILLEKEQRKRKVKNVE